MVYQGYRYLCHYTSVILQYLELVNEYWVLVKFRNHSQTDGCIITVTNKGIWMNYVVFEVSGRDAGPSSKGPRF